MQPDFGFVNGELHDREQVGVRGERTARAERQVQVAEDSSGPRRESPPQREPPRDRVVVVTPVRHLHAGRVEAERGVREALGEGVSIDGCDCEPT